MGLARDVQETCAHWSSRQRPGGIFHNAWSSTTWPCGQLKASQVNLFNEELLSTLLALP